MRPNLSRVWQGGLSWLVLHVEASWKLPMPTPHRCACASVTMLSVLLPFSVLVSQAPASFLTAASCAAALKTRARCVRCWLPCFLSIVSRPCLETIAQWTAVGDRSCEAYFPTWHWLQGHSVHGVGCSQETVGHSIPGVGCSQETVFLC